MPITDDDLKRALGSWPEFERLDAITETEDEWRLGLLFVHKRLPHYRYGYAYDTSPTTRLLKRRIELPALGGTGWALVLRQLDRFLSEDDPPELAIGWVTGEQEADLDRWIAFLDAELQARRAPP